MTRHQECRGELRDPSLSLQTDLNSRNPKQTQRAAEGAPRARQVITSMASAAVGSLMARSAFTTSISTRKNNSNNGTSVTSNCRPFFGNNRVAFVSLGQMSWAIRVHSRILVSLFEICNRIDKIWWGDERSTLALFLLGCKSMSSALIVCLFGIKLGDV